MTHNLINSQLITNLFQSRKNILKIAKHRGFDVSEYESFSINEILILYTNKQLDMLLTHPESGKKIYYKYHLVTKIQIRHVYDYMEDIFNIEEILDTNDDFVLVGKEKPTDNLISAINIEYLKNGYFINIYNIKDYLFNILDNNAVPPHKILSDAEKEMIKKKYNIMNDKQFPEISRFDPVAIAIGLRPSQVVEIIRSSPTALKTKFYRLCN
tara:strand:+ start:1019 stop:1654 length:636 start_codon:yes stop_codon:yes gene_type:complete